MDGCKDVFLNDFFAEQNRVFVVITFPGHERNQNIPAQCQLTAVSGRTIGQDLAFFDDLTLVDQRPLIDTGTLVGTQILQQFVLVGAFVVSTTNDNLRCGRPFDNAGILRQNYHAGVAGCLGFHSGADQRRLRAE